MTQRSMTEQAFFVLIALLDEPRHGYGIIGEVAALSEGRVRLKIGTLYGVLDRLVGDGLVELDREEIQQGRLRRYYRLTETGSQGVIDETERLTANASIATKRLAASDRIGKRQRAWRPATQGGAA